MRKHTRTHRSTGGNISAMEIARGKASGVRSGSPRNTPAEELARGMSEARRTGMNARSIGMGMPAGRRKFATGGHATDMGFEPKGERLRKVIKRNEVLGSPHYAHGGEIHRGMKALYHALHSHFENEPQMKKLRVKKEEMYEGEPHRYKRASGGRLWIQKAINPAHKGALHKSLGVPPGKKIPMSKIKKAEHSQSPLLRKRAHLAETLKKLHH